MSSAGLGTAIVRLIAVYALVPFSQVLGNSLAVLLDGVPTGALVTASALHAAVLLLLSLLLWLLAPAIGQKLGGSLGPSDRPPLDADAIAGVGFAILGVLLVVLAAGSLVEAWAYLAFSHTAPGFPPAVLGPSETALIYSGIAQLVLGLLVFLGRRGLARLAYAVRHA